MKHIKLESPELREEELPYKEFEYPIISRKFLPKPKNNSKKLFLDVLNNRTTRRQFTSLPFEKLNSVLWHSSRTIIKNSSKVGKRWEHRPVPSSGGKHPIDIFIFHEEQEQYALKLYQPTPHALAQLNVDQETILKLVEKVNYILPKQNATIIWFGAQFNRISAKYKFGESLVWRDAGALLTTISFVAESLELNYCPIGITGEPFVSNILNTKKVAGVGGIYLGEK